MQRARHALPPGSEMPLLRTHHQVWHVVKRTMDWYRPYWDVGPQPFPSDREWQRLVRHWVSGGTEPVWLLGDLSRNDVRLFDWRTTRLRGRYELDSAVRELMGGVRLDGLNWWEIDRPRWMLGTGWSLTPEIAGMTSKDRNGPHQRAGRGVRPARRRALADHGRRALSRAGRSRRSRRRSHSTARESRAGRSRPLRPGSSSGSICHRVFRKVASRTRG